MTENPQDHKKITETTEISRSEDSTPANLKSAAEEAQQRMLRERQHDDGAPREGEDGNITTDLAFEAKKALSLLSGTATTAPGQLRFAVGMLLELEVLDSGERMTYTVEQPLVVGRGDNLSDYLPDVDLTAHGAYRLGLSRRHAILRREKEMLVVEDLDSRNGTHINGTQISSGKSHMLHDGDEIRFGNLALRVIFK